MRNQYLLALLFIASCGHSSSPSTSPKNAAPEQQLEASANTTNPFSSCSETCAFSDACRGEPQVRTSNGEAAGWDDSSLVARCHEMFSTMSERDIKQCGATWQMGRVDCEQQDGHTASDFDLCFAPCLTTIKQ